MNTVVVVPHSRRKQLLWIRRPAEHLDQLGAEGLQEPTEHQAEFSTEAAVDPKVEDAVEKAVGGGQPHHDKLDPLGHAASRDGCGDKGHNSANS